MFESDEKFCEGSNSEDIPDEYDGSAKDDYSNL